MPGASPGHDALDSSEASSWADGHIHRDRNKIQLALVLDCDP
jgi:hypothetical protein